MSRRWLLLEAAGCLHHWAEVVAERRRLERMLRGFAMRLSNPGLAKAWGSWLEHCERQKRMAGLMEYWRTTKSQPDACKTAAVPFWRELKNAAQP